MNVTLAERNENDIPSLFTATVVLMRKTRSKPNRPARRRPPRIKTGTKRERMAQEEWDEFADPVLTETRRRAKIKGGIPYDAADSYLKREVYRFVRRQMLKKRITYIETIVQQVRFPYKPKSPTFRENPFHWVLFGLRDPEENVDWPKKWQVSRFGRQLLYAHRHDIEPDLLIGFLHQSGTPDEVYEKAADSNVREEWFHIARARDLAGELPST